MRRGDQPKFMENNGKLIGIDLSASFCAEHEWGIKDLRRMLGIEENDKVGIEKRRVNLSNKDCIHWLEKGDEAALVIYRHWDGSKTELNIDNFRELTLYSNDELTTAWSESDAGIRVKGEKNIKKLKKIHTALLANDAAVWLGGGGVFQNAGLVIAIISNIPKHNLQEMEKADNDYKSLMVEHEKIGIQKRIDDLNSEYRKSHPNSYEKPFGYFALRPSWNNHKKSKYKVMYWLNPMNQKDFDANWFSVEELELWLEGKGPVIKRKKNARV